MKHFKHMQASSAEEAANEAKGSTAWVMAGGTDLLGTLKDEIFPEYPETVIDLKTIDGLDGIAEEGDALRIGALAKLADVAESDLVKTHAAALAQAAGRVASPTIRHMGTLGGNVCQMPYQSRRGLDSPGIDGCEQCAGNQSLLFEEIFLIIWCQRLEKNRIQLRSP